MGRAQQAPHVLEALQVPSTYAPELTARELEVLQLIADGLLNKEIARHLFLSPETVKSSIEVLLRKLRATNRANAACIALRFGLIE